MRLEGKKLEAFAAATRRFPHFELPIRRLIETSENFRDICEELAEAERALAASENAPALRQAEWKELVDRLVGEVDSTLRSDVSARAR